MVDNDDFSFIGERLKLQRETERDSCFQIPRSDRNGGCDYEVTVTSEPHNRTSRKDKEAEKVATQKKGGEEGRRDLDKT